MTTDWSGVRLTELEERLSTDLQNGLNAEAVSTRLRAEGENSTYFSPRHGVVAFLYAFCCSVPFALLLPVNLFVYRLDSLPQAVLCTLCSAVFLLLYGVALSRARRVRRAAYESSLARVAVIRMGKCYMIAPRLLVRGDIVYLNEGDVVPADGVLTRAEGVYADESVLSGSHRAVPKTAAEISGQAVSDRHGSMLFANTVLLRGNATMAVTAVGAHTEVARRGKMTAPVRLAASASARLPRCGRVIGSIVFFLSLGLLLCSFLRRESIALLGDRFCTAMILCCGLAGELLPVVIDAVCAASVGRATSERRGARALIKNADRIDACGTVDCIFADLDYFYDDTAYEVVAVGNAGSLLDEIALADTEHISYDLQSLLRHVVPMEKYIAAQCPDSEGAAFARDAMTFFGRMAEGYRIDGITEYQCGMHGQVVRVRLRHAVGTSTVLRGAFGTVFPFCRLYTVGGRDQPIEPYRERILACVSKLEEAGYTVIAYASEPNSNDGVRDRITLRGFLVCRPKEREAGRALCELCDTLGIELYLFSRGTPQSVQTTVRGSDIFDGVRVCACGALKEEGADIASLLNDYELFVSPSSELKCRMIRLAQENGRRVAVVSRNTADAEAMAAADVACTAATEADFRLNRSATAERETKRPGLLVRDADVLIDYSPSSLCTVIGESGRLCAYLSVALSYLCATALPRILLAFLSALCGIPFLVPLQAVLCTLFDVLAVWSFSSLSPGERQGIRTPFSGLRDFVFTFRSVWIMCGVMALGGTLGYHLHWLSGEALQGCFFLLLLCQSILIVFRTAGKEVYRPSVLLCVGSVLLFLLLCLFIAPVGAVFSVYPTTAGFLCVSAAVLSFLCGGLIRPRTGQNKTHRK